ncbi:hypothetical protein BJX99DRAFT_238680 [Aspergillus californicus]
MSWSRSSFLFLYSVHTHPCLIPVIDVLQRKRKQSCMFLLVSCLVFFSFLPDPWSILFLKASTQG